MKKNKTPAIYPFVLVKDLDATIQFIEQVFGIQSKREERNDQGQLTRIWLKLYNDDLLFAKSQDDQILHTSLYIYTPNMDDIFRNAQTLGAKPIMQPQRDLKKRRICAFTDQSGITWWLEELE